MQEYACKNIGLECNYRTTGMTKEDAMKKALEHGMKAHGEMMSKMSKEESEQFTKKIENSLRPV